MKILLTFNGDQPSGINNSQLFYSQAHLDEWLTPLKEAGILKDAKINGDRLDFTKVIRLEDDTERYIACRATIEEKPDDFHN